MHKKTKFDQPRQARRQRALDRFPLENVHAMAKHMNAHPVQGRMTGTDYLANRLQEYANLEARCSRSQK